MRDRLLLGCLFAFVLSAQDLLPGAIIDEVKCSGDPGQSYALYVPKAYRANRKWPVIFAFDPRARGRTPVERYQAGAERFGYIVAGSNVSRNGSWEVSMRAAQAMMRDIGQRFEIDEKRVYTAGMSGGARVAMGVALGTNFMAGVIASSAGYPDSSPRKTVPFAVFGTAGTEDFNYLEMRQLERVLGSPHHVAIFEGGHVWLSSELAEEALAWMELQAIKEGRREKDPAFVDSLFAGRESKLVQLSGRRLCEAVESMVADFDGLKDVAVLRSRAAALRRQKDVKDEYKRDRDELQREEHMLAEFFDLERGLALSESRPASLAQLKDRISQLAKKSNAPEDSADRRLARRVLRGTMMGATERTQDPEYRKLVEQHRPSFGRGESKQGPAR